MNQYTQEMCPGGGQGGTGGPGNLFGEPGKCPGGGRGGPRNLFGDPGKLTRHKDGLH